MSNELYKSVYGRLVLFGSPIIIFMTVYICTYA